MSRLNKRHITNWIDRKVEPLSPFNPKYPNGVAVDYTAGQMPTCLVKFDPYPTPRCGWWSVVCEECGLTVVLTTAGRIDDPISVRLACKKPSSMNN